jgi:hypothetical protein
MIFHIPHASPHITPGQRPKIFLPAEPLARRDVSVSEGVAEDGVDVLAGTVSMYYMKISNQRSLRPARSMKSSFGWHARMVFWVIKI